MGNRHTGTSKARSNSEQVKKINEENQKLIAKKVNEKKEKVDEKKKIQSEKIEESKMQEKIKWSKAILEIAVAILLFCLPLCLISLNAELIVGDEIWNFQNIHKMINGATMYENCNIIITPIFYLIGYCFVKLITGTILGFRIYNVFIFLGLLSTCYGLFRTLKIKKIKSFIYTLLIFLFVMPYITVGANYNVLAESIFIFGIVLFLNKDRIKFYNLIQGIVIFACIFTKQNIGLYYLLAIIIAEITAYKKDSVHYIIREIMVSLVCTLIAVLIMCMAGCFRGFLNYTIYGMGEFTTENFIIQDGVKIVIIGYLAIALCSYILGFLLSRQNKETTNNIEILCVFSIMLNISILPIANMYHTSFAILVNLIIFIYIFEKLLLSKLNNKVALIIIATVFYLAVNSYGIVCGLRSEKNIRIVDKENVYYSSNLSKELNDRLENVKSYIKAKEKEGIDVICISADSPLYMTALNKNHDELDLCFTGNLGYHGKERTLEKVQELKDTEIFINTDEYWQEVEEIKTWVRENCTEEENLDILNVYKTK